MTAARAPRFFALIACAGSGRRAGGDIPKQYQSLAGKPMVLHTLDAFSKVERITKTFVVVSPQDEVFATFNLDTEILACGGAARSETVNNALQSLMDKGCDSTDWVLVHDAARCLITPLQINNLIDECQHDAVGGLLACPVTDTLIVSAAGRVDQAVARDERWAAQTPQMFRIGSLQAALGMALQADIAVTDESSALERIGHKPKLVKTSSENFKVTHPEDFALAEVILISRNKTMPDSPALTPLFRIGEGWDTHQLVEGGPLVLGGVAVPFNRRLLGHSDADALCHAITDALLGAAALGDIGKHFPDIDPRYKGADSIALLKHTAALVRTAGWNIGNVDSTVIAEAPKLAPYIDDMRKNLSHALGVEIAQVSVKAKTAERMGPVGEGLTIEARATVLIWISRPAFN